MSRRRRDGGGHGSWLQCRPCIARLPRPLAGVRSLRCSARHPGSAIGCGGLFPAVGPPRRRRARAHGGRTPRATVTGEAARRRRASPAIEHATTPRRRYVPRHAAGGGILGDRINRGRPLRRGGGARVRAARRGPAPDPRRVTPAAPRTSAAAARLAWLLRQSPDVVVVELGANDGCAAAVDGVEDNRAPSSSARAPPRARVRLACACREPRRRLTRAASPPSTRSRAPVEVTFMHSCSRASRNPEPTSPRHPPNAEGTPRSGGVQGPSTVIAAPGRQALAAAWRRGRRRHGAAAADAASRLDAGIAITTSSMWRANPAARDMGISASSGWLLAKWRPPRRWLRGKLAVERAVDQRAGHVQYPPPGS